MKLLSPSKQFKLLSDTLAVVSEAVGEELKVNMIFGAFEKLGFKGNIRCRIAVIEESGTVLAMKYARGDYGSINMLDIRYNIGGSITGRALIEKRPLFRGFENKKSNIKFVSNRWHKIAYSMKNILGIPLLKSGKPMGVLTFDSPEENGFSEASIDALRPYSYLIAEVISSSVGVHEDDVISSVRRFRKQQILVLGKDTGPELQYLVHISEYIKKCGYSPLLVKDYPDIPELSNEEKVRVFADNSRFVILENTFPAGQIAECKMCAINRIICAAIRQQGKGSSYMVTDYFKDFDFMAEFEYEDSQESMEHTLTQATEWAEKKIKERIEYYNSIYPWRKDEISKAKI